MHRQFVLNNCTTSFVDVVLLSQISLQASGCHELLTGSDQNLLLRLLRFSLALGPMVCRKREFGGPARICSARSHPSLP